MHLWKWSHYLIHPKLSLLPYPLHWKYHHSLQCIPEVSSFFIPLLKSITLLVKSLISMNRNQLKLADWGSAREEGFVIKVQWFSQNPRKRTYLGLDGLRTVQWGFFPSLVFAFLSISLSFSCLSQIDFLCFSVHFSGEIWASRAPKFLSFPVKRPASVVNPGQVHSG